MKNKGREGEKLFIKTINSGAFFQKGDAISDKHCVEIKTTEKKSFRITADLLKKIWEEAFDQNKFPMFGIVIKREDVDWILKIDIVKRRK
ncbi:MAG TPA: hypothetical protein VMZ91_16345 [Candidatus Paceibacterota bacterium]|nr:hypothetical protein [Candidatus Paceibacterota bacterium]